MRVVDGRRLTARGFPARSSAASIGRDPVGRIVVTAFRQPRSTRAPTYPTWWLYDVAADVARRVHPPTRNRCYAEGLAVWRARTAYAEACYEQTGDEWGVGGRRIVLRVGRRDAKWDAPPGGFSRPEIALNSQSLFALLEYGDAGVVRRIQAHGRWCPGDLTYVDEEYDLLDPIAVGGRAVVWGMADQPFGDPSRRFAHFMLQAFDLSRDCRAHPEQRYMPFELPSAPMRAVALDSRFVYYATDQAIYRQRLPRRGSVAPPANDDFHHAAGLSAEPPFEAFGRTGYATLEPGEPALVSGDLRARRSVWYSFTPTRAQTVHLWLTGGWLYRLFTGTTLATLVPLTEATFGADECPIVLDVLPLRTYHLVVGAGDRAPNLRPFIIRAARAGDESLPPYCT
jgi:hypothetical protein